MPPSRSGSAKLPVFLLFTVTATLVLIYLGGLLEVVLISALVVYILDPVVTTFESSGTSRTMATVTTLLLLSVVLAVVAVTLAPQFTAQLQALQTGFTSESTKTMIDDLDRAIRERVGFLGIENVNLAGRIQAMKLNFVDRIFEYLVTDFTSLIIRLVIIPFIIFFLLKDGREMRKEFVRIIPNRYFEFSLDLMYKMHRQLGMYLRSQFLDALIFGILATCALWLLDVRYFLFIGAFAGLANLIPYVGPAAGGLLAVSVAVLDKGDPFAGLYVALTFLLLKLIDDVLVQPTVVARGVKLHPLVVLFAVTIGGHLFGILGMLLAVPAAGFFKVVVRESVVTFRKYRFT